MKSIGFRLFRFAVLALFTVIFLYPIVYAVYYSLLPLPDIGKIVPISHFTLESYTDLYNNYPVGRWILNTLIVTVSVVTFSVILNSMAGYALARWEFPGKKVIFAIVLGSMMIPYQFVITPVYIQLAHLQWNDQLIGIIVPFIINCLYIFMARQFFLSVPKELEEAARVDGLGLIGTFFRIVAPISAPLVVSIIILNFTGTWNFYIGPATFINNRNNYVLSVGIKTVKDFMYDRKNQTLAGVVVLSLPILIMFTIMQKHFVEGIATTGIKG